MLKMVDAEKHDESSPGAWSYRSYIDWPGEYNLGGASQFNLVTQLGLREKHFLLEIACGSLRVGRLLIPYLLPGRYCGIEPQQWLIEDALKHELGAAIIPQKTPRFRNDSEFNLTAFNQKFDFILCNLLFGHINQTLIKKCLSEAQQVLSENGLFLANFELGEKSYYGNKCSYPDHEEYTLEHIKACAEEKNLICKQINWHGPTAKTIWVVFKHPHLKQEPLLTTEATQIEIETIKRRFLRYQNHPYVRFGYFLWRLKEKTLNWWSRFFN